MIITFGDILIGTEIELKQELAQNSQIQALGNYTNINGSSALTAISAARACAHVGIIGSIGKDMFADQILKIFRKEGIQTTGLSQTDQETGSLTILKFGSQNTYVKNAGANLLSSHHQIPDTAMNERTLLVLHADFDDHENEKLIERARKNGTKTLLSCGCDVANIPDYAQNCDVLITDGETEFKPTEQTTHINAIKAGTQNILVNNEMWHNEENREKETIKDLSGAFEAFCGTFAACYQARTNIESAIEYAKAAATLSATQKGSYASLPYLGNIEEYLKQSIEKQA